MTPMRTFEASASGSKRIIEQLDAYFRAEVVGCDHLASCRLSAARKGLCFNAAQLPHVGAAYDLSGNGRSWRIAVCGQEVGRAQTGPRSIAERSPITSAKGRVTPFAARNPHMQGTTNALRLLYGRPLSLDSRDDLILVNGEYRHIYDTFALINALSCSATPGETGKNGRSTSEMKRNCVRHLRATVQILRPTILVVQGNTAAEMLRAAFPDIEVLGETGVRIPSLNTIAATLPHPSARRDTRRGARADLAWAALNSPYLHAVVAPLLSGLYRLHQEAGR
jgi:hypothetical protein